MTGKTPRNAAGGAAPAKSEPRAAVEGAQEKAARATRRLVEMPEPQITAPQAGPDTPARRRGSPTAGVARAPTPAGPVNPVRKPAAKPDVKPAFKPKPTAGPPRKRPRKPS